MKAVKFSLYLIVFHEEMGTRLCILGEMNQTLGADWEKSREGFSVITDVEEVPGWEATLL